ncbi:MAG: U32 family peptidase [Promethearchaeota archaeon]|nr:MAG: U32 family peptidase [Candidatus Lokiarchaeota archaeon]
MAVKSSKKVELLSPLKNIQSLNAILKFADAVYFGIEDLNMRAFSDNIALKNLNYIVKKCHDYNIKTYLTTNVIVYDNEFDLVNKILTSAQEAEVDAIIVHDIGIIEAIKERGLEFHISTQANISNLGTARFYERIGAERLILARELSLNQIKYIKQKLSRAQIETFIHGAQCTSISGRCYFSAEFQSSQHFSANRGRCTQPCRRKWKLTDESNNEVLYDGTFFINTKDLCMIEYIPNLIEAQIDAFKIEGRMRDPIYIEETTACYREAIDSYYNGDFNEEKVKNWLKRLKKVYNRGFSTGFYFNVPTEKEISRDQSGNVSNYKKKEIGKVINYFPKNKAAKILLYDGSLKLGEEIFIIGAHTSTYLRQKISSIQIKRKKNYVETPKANKNNKIAVGIIVDKPVKKNDRVYKLIKRK